MNGKEKEDRAIIIEEILKNEITIVQRSESSKHIQISTYRANP
jgi:hypothetical protein